MINFTITAYEFVDEPKYLVEDIPRNYTYADGRTFVVTDNDNNEALVFICRFYRLTENVQHRMGYPKCYDYELGSVYMFEDYRGRGLARPILERILADVIGNIILWTSSDNEIAIKLYDKIFRRVSLKCTWTNETREVLRMKGYPCVIFFHS